MIATAGKDVGVEGVESSPAPSCHTPTSPESNPKPPRCRHPRGCPHRCPICSWFVGRPNHVCHGSPPPKPNYLLTLDERLVALPVRFNRARFRRLWAGCRAPPIAERDAVLRGLVAEGRIILRGNGRYSLTAADLLAPDRRRPL